MRKWVTPTLCAAVITAFCLSGLLMAAPSDSPVADAAQRSDTTSVKSLLKDAADVNAAQGDGMTALHWAAMHGDTAMVQTLLYAGANVNATTRLGPYTPLYLAARQGETSAMDLLLKAGADPEAKTANGGTSLMVAAASGNTDAVKLLLDHGAKVNEKESVRGETALMFAAAYDRPAVIALLAQHGAKVSDTTTVIDLDALSRDNPTLLRAILFGNPPPPPSKKKPAAAAEAKPGAEGVAQAPAEKAEASAKPAADAAAKPAAEASAKPAPAKDAKGAKARPGQKPEAQVAENDAKKPEVASKDKKKEDEGFDEFDFEAASNKKNGKPQIPGVDRGFQQNELVGHQGGMTALLLASRQGYSDAVDALLAAGADVNQVAAGDKTSALLIATINGHFDLAEALLAHGANPNLIAENGVAPLYAAINCEWAQKSLYPQPQAYKQQKTTYLALMKDLLDHGANPNVRVNRKVWYSGYSFDLSGVDEIGATAFWRAAYASDIDAMKLLMAHGADPGIPTMKPAGRSFTGGTARAVKDVSGLPPIPVGGPGVPPLLAASGEGYGEGFAANSHRFAPTGMLAAVKYLVEDLHADVNARDQNGQTALHNAASRGDNAMMLYLVSKGADIKAVDREGRTVADMANGPVQRIQPFPDTIALAEKLGSKNNHHCVSC